MVYCYLLFYTFAVSSDRLQCRCINEADGCLCSFFSEGTTQQGVSDAAAPPGDDSSNGPGAAAGLCSGLLD